MTWPRRTDACASGSARWKAGKRAHPTAAARTPGAARPPRLRLQAVPPCRPRRQPLIRRDGVRRQLGSGVCHSRGWPRRRPRGTAITRDEAQAWFTRFLLRRVGRDDYPSTTQLDLIEKSIPRELLDEYLGVLVDKVAHDRFPSVPLLHRIQHLIECLPHTGHAHRPRRAGRDDPEHHATTATEPDEKTGTAASTRADEEKSR